MNKLYFYLVSTDHLPDALWFRDDADFRVGMNYVALVANATGVRILAFILMSNHVHFVLEGSREAVLAFITEFKRRYSKYFQSRYAIREFLRENRVDIQAISLDGESMERAIAYVQMNSVAANICAHSAQYSWGTGPVFFNPSIQEGVSLDSLSRRKQIAVLHSNDIPPKGLRLTPSGYVDPFSYVNVRFVERLFRSPARYNYFLQHSSKARVRLQESALPSFRDQSILTVLPDLCKSLFRKESIQDLSLEQTAELLKQLQYRFSADLAQISRVLGLSYAEAARLLDSI